MQRLAILTMLASVLAVAGCNENTGWNPNYSAIRNGTPYAAYLQKREVALVGQGPVPQVIPVQLPANAPSVLDLGATPTSTTPAKAVLVEGSRAPVTTTGPYAGTTPVLVKYAHQEQQNPGTSLYKRTGGSVAQSARLCSNYPSVDAAQRGFIANGGPLLDPRGMDPDGDGFVCGWDPRPVRQSNGL
ncbi:MULTISPECIES: hypothetical protein [Paracoccus]|jgi:hypothetical protein|uniref:Excalibur calcium-binding domain-containing protein n=1 Tax=Paracoccus litorisediminis TaxID=2006130 RepID=A0A844HHF1_9RHOB|nr:MULTISPECIES: hypothetical protein [Paracoccus]MBD9525928.1 hypothetical protein [Paracoccus sp. PAR01]MTH58379.1 hypothetical protein [Paracoccus litorisediminis]